MVTGFEELTKPLSSFEKEEIVPYIARRIKMNIGRDNRVYARVMIEKFNKATNKERVLKNGTKRRYKLNGSKLRRIIHFIRLNNIVTNLIATSDGYWVTENPDEIESYLKSLKERSNSFHQIYCAMRDYNLKNPL